MPIKPPLPLYGGNQMITPFTYGPPRGRFAPPEEVFDRMLESYAYEVPRRTTAQYSPPSAIVPPRRMEISAIPVEDARRLFCNYVSHWEGFYRNVSQVLNEHMAVCASPPPILADIREQDFRSLFSQGYVVNADRRSGKTQALFDEADEVSKGTCSRITIIAPRKECALAEANRRRLMNAEPNQFARLEFTGQDELYKLEGGLGRDVMVDDWWDLDERSRELLASRCNIMAAVGTMRHGTRVPIQARTIHDEDAFYGRKESTFNPMAMARWSDARRK